MEKGLTSWNPNQKNRGYFALGQNKIWRVDTGMSDAFGKIDKKIQVNDVLHGVKNFSSASLNRKLRKLREKKILSFESSPTDERVRFIKKGLNYSALNIIGSKHQPHNAIRTLHNIFSGMHPKVGRGRDQVVKN